MADTGTKPTVITTDKHSDLRVEQSVFEPLPGEYHLIEVDHAGNEISGTDFSIPVRQYERTYKNLKNFKVKKNPF